MYQVFEDDRPAQFPDFKVDPSWDKSVFPTFDEALIYARKWIYPYGGAVDGKEGVMLTVNVPYDYAGIGSYILIKEIQ